MANDGWEAELRKNESPKAARVFSHKMSSSCGSKSVPRKNESRRIRQTLKFEGQTIYDDICDISREEFHEEERAPITRNVNFVNSHFSYILKSNKDYSSILLNPDEEVDWENVVVVIGRIYTRVACPICLSDVIIVPRITKCGHIMCYPCLVSYFSIFPEDEKKCPICMNRISARCLRPVAISVFPGSEDEQKEQVQKVVQNNQEQVQNKHKKSVTIKMRLMKRHNMVMIALTRRNYDIWAQETKCESLPSCLNPENLKFSKFTLEPNENFLSNILEDDLLELLSLESTEDDTISLSADRLLSEITSLRENASQNAPLQNTPSDHLSIAKINDILSRNDSSEYEIEYPSQDDGASAYLYYQCSSGKPLFLDPLDNKIVMATYKEYLNLPDLIEVTVHSTQNFSVSEYTRSRYKFLAHLFLGTEAKFCETDLVYKCPEEVSKMLGKRLEARKNKLNYLIYNKNCTKDKEEVFMEDAVLSHELEFYDPIVLPPLNDMRHWPEIGSSANTPLAKNSSNDVEGSTNDVEGSTNDVEGSTSDIKGSANDIKCSTNDIKCSTNDVEGSTSDIKGSANDIKCSTDNIKGSSDHIKGSSDHIKDNQPIMSFAEVLTLSIKRSQDEE